jgi:hypothetical protein
MLHNKSIFFYNEVLQRSITTKYYNEVLQRSITKKFTLYNKFSVDCFQNTLPNRRPGYLLV